MKKFEEYKTENCKEFACGTVWVCNFVSDIKEGT
jgi:hypothetical protein